MKKFSLKYQTTDGKPHEYRTDMLGIFLQEVKHLYESKIVDSSSFKIETFEEDEIKVETPVLIGTLARKMGWNGYHESEVGTPVYEFEGKFQIESHPINPKLPIRIVKFYKDSNLPINPLCP